MKKLVLVFVLAVAFAFVSHASLGAQNQELQRWEQQARNVTIIRDDWGIAHISGKTDADAVFGVIYAQAEDDFNRVETNYINSMGRLAEAEGEAAVWRDLRMKLFIDPDAMKAQYEASPAWLKALMNAWADGLNFYLARHPTGDAEGHQALRTVDGADLQRGQHRRRHRDDKPRASCRLFTETFRSAVASNDERELARRANGIERHRHLAVEHGRAPRAAADQSAHVFLL